MIIPRSCSRARGWEHLCPRLYSGCGSGHSLGGWGRQLESRCLEEAMAGQLRREPLATASGDREPRPGREQGGPEAWALWGFSINCVCKGAGGVLVIAGGIGGHSSPSPAPGPKAPPFPLPLETGLCGHLSAPPPACPSKLQGTWKPSANHPSLTLLLQLVYFSNLNFIFLER